MKNLFLAILLLITVGFANAQEYSMDYDPLQRQKTYTIKSTPISYPAPYDSYENPMKFTQPSGKSVFPQTYSIEVWSDKDLPKFYDVTVANDPYIGTRVTIFDYNQLYNNSTIKVRQKLF